MNLQLVFESVLLAIVVMNSVKVLGGGHYVAPTLFRVNFIRLIHVVLRIVLVDQSPHLPDQKNSKRNVDGSVSQYVDNSSLYSISNLTNTLSSNGGLYLPS